jgi:uncharacterized protein YyaL (SSP411 family)
MSRNLLDQETSPYLLLHKDNPVHWRPWGAEALAEAESTGKPILLSIGYTACHWCHVMNNESFADPDTAALMNENFINVKVDREERPDIDLIYQTAITQMGGQGGWPLTMFLTAKGEPYFAGTYFPPVEREGAPAFKKILGDVATLYRDKPDEVANASTGVSQGLANLWGRNLRGRFDPAPLDQAALRLGQRFDIFFGGMTGAPKFPSTGHIETLFRGYLRTGIIQFNMLAQTTLTNICMGGIYDHLAGGFARYSTDERWLVPHFEKILHDNALLIDILMLCWQQDRNPLYRARIEETVNWVLREMMADQGFASSVDADSEGEEGRYYIWSDAEIDAALAGTFVQKFKEVYGITREGDIAGRNVLNRLGPGATFPLPNADEALLAKQRELLLAVRDKRVAPVRDDKVLADANAMMIAALARAGSVFRKPAWTLAAAHAFDFVEKVLGDGERLYHSWREGKRQHSGFSEDYAHMARAGLALWEATNDRRYLERTKIWVRVLNEHFWDQQNGGYFHTADDSEQLIARARSVFDMSMPCTNGIMGGLLSKLYLATLDPLYRDRCNALIEAFSGEFGRAYISMGAYMSSLETVAAGLQVVIVGPITNPKTHELVSAVMGRALPNGMLVMVDPGEKLPEGHPAQGKTMIDGRPTAYICQRMTCEQPITNPVTLSQALQLPPLPQQQPQQPMPQPAGRA